MVNFITITQTPDSGLNEKKMLCCFLSSGVDLMINQFDIDLDFPDRMQALSLIRHTPATIVNGDKISKHNSGVYVTSVPTDALSGNASIDYKIAEERGYFKFDFLNLNLYQQIKSEKHLDILMNTEPDWTKLYDEEFCSKLIHVGNHYNLLLQMNYVVDSIEKMAAFLAVIRPAKRHLLHMSFEEMSETVWDRNVEGYTFRRSHAVAYSTLVVVNMNLLSVADFSN